MKKEPTNPLTQLLAAIGRGEPGAREKMWPLVYDELRCVARRQLDDEALAHRRQPTSIVHETFLRLAAGQDVKCANRRQFFAMAARAMRQIRIDDARKRNAVKRGGGERPLPLDDALVGSTADPVEMFAIDEALNKLVQVDQRQAEVVMLRYFGGMTIDETADALEMSSRTVDNEWRLARAWLYRELTDTGNQPG